MPETIKIYNSMPQILQFYASIVGAAFDQEVDFTIHPLEEIHEFAPFKSSARELPQLRAMLKLNRLYSPEIENPQADSINPLKWINIDFAFPQHLIDDNISPFRHHVHSDTLQYLLAYHRIVGHLYIYPLTSSKHVEGKAPFLHKVS